MKRISNSHSTIKYNPIFDAIEVHFDDQGTVKTYYETMEDALNLALLEHVNRWIFVKSAFSDLSMDEFVRLLRKWVVKGCSILKSQGVATLCEVAIITKSQAGEKLKLKFSKLQDNQELGENLDINICKTEEEIYEYF